MSLIVFIKWDFQIWAYFLAGGQYPKQIFWYALIILELLLIIWGNWASFPLFQKGNFLPYLVRPFLFHYS